MCHMDGLTESEFVTAAASFNSMGKKRGQKKTSTNNLPASKIKGGKGNKTNRDEEKGKTNNKPPKGKLNKKDSKNRRGGEDDEDTNTLMKRRRRTELQIQVCLLMHIFCFHICQINFPTSEGRGHWFVETGAPPALPAVQRHGATCRGHALP